jgi:hypothetical protein
VGREQGQAGIETLVALPLIALLLLAGMQALGVAAASVYGSAAAAAGARALARGAPPVAAARAELPGPFARRAQVQVAGGAVSVRIRVPSLVPGVPAIGVDEQASP